MEILLFIYFNIKFSFLGVKTKSVEYNICSIFFNSFLLLLLLIQPIFIHAELFINFQYNVCVNYIIFLVVVRLVCLYVRSSIGVKTNKNQSTEAILCFFFLANIFSFFVIQRNGNIIFQWHKVDQESFVWFLCL